MINRQKHNNISQQITPPDRCYAGLPVGRQALHSASELGRYV